MTTDTTLRPSLPELIRRGLVARGFRTNLAYALGRFHGVRRAYSRAMGTAQRMGMTRTSCLVPHEHSLLPPIDLSRAVHDLESTSRFMQLQLPAPVVNEIYRFALDSICQPREGGPSRFRYHEVVNGRLPNGVPVIIGDVMQLEHLPVLGQVAHDPQVLAVVAAYTGYVPQHVDQWLHWSFAGEQSDEYRRTHGQTIDYHYDVHGYNFVYASYYLTDVDERSGAHVLIEQTHKDKPVRWLFDTARRSDQEIRAHYGTEREHVIIGKAGDGFIEDTSCYHKALAPIERDRLLLQFRYY